MLYTLNPFIWWQCVYVAYLARCWAFHHVHYTNAIISSNVSFAHTVPPCKFTKHYLKNLWHFQSHAARILSEMRVCICVWISKVLRKNVHTNAKRIFARRVKLINKQTYAPIVFSMNEPVLFGSTTNPMAFLA